MLAYQTCSWNTWQADIAVIVAFDLLIKICSVSKTGFLIYLTFNLQVFNISSHKTILQQDLLTNLFQVVLAFDNFNFFFFLLLYLSFNFKMASLFFFFFCLWSPQTSTVESLNTTLLKTLWNSKLVTFVMFHLLRRFYRVYTIAMNKISIYML